MEIIGARLKKARLEKGLTLDEVHKKTKIQLAILKAIEEGGVANVSPIYLKGFIKIYCDFLGVDFKDYYLDTRGASTPAHSEPIADDHPRPISYISSASTKLDTLRSGPSTNRTRLIIIVGLCVLSLVLFITIITMKKKIAATTSHLAAPAQKQQSPPGDSAKSKKTPTGRVTLRPQPLRLGSTTATSGIRLILSAREDCWIKVKSDGKLLYQGILKKGRSDAWQAKERINLSLANAGAVELNINGQIFTGLGKRGQTLNDIVITSREGLVIR